MYFAISYYLYTFSIIKKYMCLFDKCSQLTCCHVPACPTKIFITILNGKYFECTFPYSIIARVNRTKNIAKVCIPIEPTHSTASDQLKEQGQNVFHGAILGWSSMFVHSVSDFSDA